MKIEEKLEPYKDNEKFYESYLDCEPIENIEGQVIENAKWCGYALSDAYGNRWFTDYGIRGISKGTFFVFNGEPHKMVTVPEYDTLDIVCKMIESGIKSRSMIKYHWYQYQINHLKVQLANKDEKIKK